jgi:hypothetical protein
MPVGLIANFTAGQTFKILPWQSLEYMDINLTHALNIWVEPTKKGSAWENPWQECCFKY